MNRTGLGLGSLNHALIDLDLSISKHKLTIHVLDPVHTTKLFKFPDLKFVQLHLNRRIKKKIGRERFICYCRTPDDNVTGNSSFSIGDSLHGIRHRFFGDLISKLLSFGQLLRSHDYGEIFLGQLERETALHITSSW